MKKVFTIVVMMMVCTHIMAWTPSLRYAGWIGDFRVDRAWENVTEPKANEGSSKSWGDRYNHVKMVEMPNCIAWSCMIWDEHCGSGDDYQLNKGRLYLYNKQTKATLDIVFLQMNTSDDNDTKFDYMTDYNGNDTRIAGRRFFDKDDGSQHMFLTTKISSQTRKFIEEAGKDNLQIGWWCHWDDSHWNDFDRKSDVAIHWTEDFVFMSIAKPTLSDVEWCDKDGKTGIAYSVDDNPGTVTVDLVSSNGTSYASLTGNSNGSLASNQITKDVLEKASMGVRPTTKKTYTMQGTWYSPYSMSNYSNYVSAVGDIYYPKRSQQAQGLSAVKENGAKIRVKWGVSNREAGKSYDNVGWVIERAKSADFSGELMQESIGYSSSKSSYEYVDEMSEREMGNVTYFYRVYRANTAENYNNGSKDNYKECTINTNYPRVSNLEGTSHGSNAILTWEISDGLWNDQTMKVELNYKDRTLQFDRDQTSKEIAMQSCDPTTFTLRVMEGNEERSRTELVNFVLPSTVPSQIEKVSISKGYYNDYTPIRWTIDKNAANFSHFVVKRKEYGMADETYQSLTTIQYTPGVYQYSYEDHTSVAGAYYEYCIDGYTTCDEQVNIAASQKDIGFAQPYGVVSGQIAYDGNQGVEGVTVMVVGEGKRQNRSLYFYDQQSRMKMDLDGQLTTNEGCVEMWMRPDTDRTTYRMAQYKHILFTVERENLQSHRFNHIAWSWKGGYITTYVNGQQVGDPVAISTGSSQDSLVIGDPAYRGWIDEVRVWNMSRTHAQVAADHDRYLNGSEMGLIGYYRCDDDLPNVAYDISRISTNYNEHHAMTCHTRIDHSNTPTQEQLALKTMTDASGNYLLNMVPYTAEGCLYTIVPSLGVHEFAPNNRPLFFDANTSTHNGIDFKDVSSFEVSGTVKYANTDYPVEGCQFFVDGALCIRNEKPVTSDENGEFTISVPIGSHYVTIQKAGHTFEYAGRFPADPDGVGTRFDFNQPRTIDFIDNTTVLFVGRVAGGVEEAAKPHGMNMGKATIGKATLKLTPKKLRDLNLSTSETRVFDKPDTVACASQTFALPATEGRAKYITIQTDSATGEFVAQLPPIDFTLDKITIDNDPTINISTSLYGDITLESSNINEMKIDSIRVNDTLRWFKYFQKLDVIYRVDPVMDITDLTNPDGAFGDKVYLAAGVTGGTTEVPLYTKDEQTGKINYLYTYPIFTQGSNYAWYVHAYEPYINRDKAELDTTKVPLSFGKVTFLNDLGAGTHTDTTDTTIKQLGSTYQLSAMGDLTYRFTAGDPTVSAPYTKSMTITYTDSASRGVYNGFDGPWEGIIFGAKTSGTNFVTMGVDKPMFVLRDPPGAQSSATWKKGHTMIYTETYDSTYNAGGSADLVHLANCEVQTVTGSLIFGVITESASNDNEGGAKTDYEHEWLHKREKNTTITTEQDITTRTDLLYAGSAGDVFVGASTNMLFGNARHVKLDRDEASATGWKIGVSDAIATGELFATSFQYTQRHIEESLIPNFKRLRNSVLRYVPAAEDTITVNPYSYPLHITHLSPSDPRFGSANYDKAVWGNQAVADTMLSGPSYRTILPSDGAYEFMVDSVDHYNAQIRMWEHTLAENEHMKVLAQSHSDKFDAEQWAKAAEKSSKEGMTIWEAYKGGYLDDNLSFDGGTTITKNYSVSHSVMVNTGYSNKVQTYIHTKIGVKIFGIGGYVSANGGGGYKRTETSGSTDSDTEGVSYTLAANDREVLTVDVMHAPDNFGPIFLTRGGQTYCPYEGEEVAKYYEPEKQHVLQTATVKMEDPVLSASQVSRINVPVGKAAYFDVKLANEADIENRGSWMFLYVVDASNPHGAAVSLDGASLNGGGRKIYMNSKTPIQKSISISQTREDILDYDSIAIVLASDCSPYIEADTIYLSAHFIPSCSDVALRIDEPILNNANMDTTLHVIINNYDTTYRSLESIRLEYRQEGQNIWHKAHEWVKNPHAQLQEGQDYLPAAQINYVVKMKNFADGTYVFRAVSSCFYSTAETPQESENITVVKDYSRPVALGLPSPINGIYTADNEIYVLFNEPIQKGMVTASNVSVTGVLNARDIQHDVAYRMSPNQMEPAMTDAQYDLSNRNFAIVCWLYIEKDGLLFSHNNGGLLISTRNDGKLMVEINQNGEMDVAISTTALPKNKWMYLAVLLESTETGKMQMDAFVSYDATTEHLITHESYIGYAQRGVLSLGYSNLSLAQGAMHDLQLWVGDISWATIQSTMYVTKELYRDNLYGYWPMNEGEGRVLHDKMRDRHMVAPGEDWYYSDPNYAVRIASGTKAYMNISDRAMNSLSDYALEFWFRTSEEGTLISSNSKDSIEIGLKDNRLYIVTKYGEGYQQLDRSYTDGQWHHMAILVHHVDNTQVLLDGNSMMLKTYNIVNDLNGSRLYFGNDSTQLDIDEVRFWNATVTADWIRDNNRIRLSGNEPGLMTYIPMERRNVLQGIETFTADLSDMSTKEGYDHSYGLRTENSLLALASVNDAPAMRAHKHAADVKHSYVASENMIVISVNEEPALIEGCTLNFSVKDIVDKHGNYSPEIKWTAFVNRNRLIWEEDHVQVAKEVLETKQVQLSFRNLSGETEDWRIENLPSYISVSQLTGSLRPQQQMTLTLTIAPSLAIGHYDPVFYLVGNEGIKVAMNMDIHVTGDKPDWRVDESQYEYTMNLIGRLWSMTIEPDTTDMLVAFVNGEVAGIAHPQAINSNGVNYIMLDVYANLTDAEQDAINHNQPISKPITFRYWDASMGFVYSNVETLIGIDKVTINYQPNALVGSFEDPVNFDLGFKVEQTVHLQKGWNWTSYNVLSGEVDLTETLSELLPYIGLMKSQEAFVKADTVRKTLNGNLTMIDSYKAYKTLALQEVTKHIEGYPVDPIAVEITLKKGWTWIGYVPQVTLSVPMALSNMDPEEGDIIKARSGFAVWHNNAWVGSLAAMTPGQGYMYYNSSNQTKSFHYPSYLASQMLAPRRMSAGEIQTYHYNPIAPSAYSGNMTMTAIVKKGEEQITDAEVAFFVGDECRTTMRSEADGYYYFTIPGDETTILNLRAWYNGQEYRPEQTIYFIEDADYGSVDEPVVIQLDASTGLGGIRAKEQVRKVVKDHAVYIIRNNKWFNILGEETK